MFSFNLAKRSFSICRDQINNKFFGNNRFYTTVKKVGIDSLGIVNPQAVHHNLSYPELFQHEKANKEGVVMNAKYGNTFAIDTGKFTGRSPSDKWIVKNIGSESEKISGGVMLTNLQHLKFLMTYTIVQ